jgi:hypothetical protein
VAAPGSATGIPKKAVIRAGSSVENTAGKAGPSSFVASNPAVGLSGTKSLGSQDISDQCATY